MEQNFNSYNTAEFPRRPRKPVNYFELASWAFAVAALFSCMFFYISYICGALAIVFALLSRGGQMTFSRKSKAALFLGVFAIIFTTAITIGAVYFTIQEYGSLEAVLREYCEILGYDFEELYGNMF